MEYAFDVPVDDIGFVNDVKAVQQVFVVTWVDFITKMLPFLSMANCLSQIKRHVTPLLRPSLDEVSSNTRQKISVASPSSSTLTQRFRPSVLSSGIQKAVNASTRARSRVQWICRMRVIQWPVSARVVHSRFFIWSVLLVGFHIDANLDTHNAVETIRIGCKSSSTPWVVTKLSCTILEINCYRQGISGHADEIATALDRVDASTLASLIITHCPQLTMPPQLQTLSNLIGLEVTNATTVPWAENAALDHDRLPALQYMSIARVNMTALPEGLQSSNFPRGRGR